MRGLSEVGVLDAWERGQGRGPQERAVAPLLAAFPERGIEELMTSPIGERDRLLLRLRAATLGPILAATTTCPRCEAEVDLAVAVEDLLAAGAGEAEKGEVDASEAGEHVLSAGGFDIRFRLLDSRDLAFAGAATEVEEARARLLERAVLDARRDDGESVATAELPAEVVAALGEALDRRDPLAVTPLAVACDRCGHHWLPLLDVAVFVWNELAARAERVMYDVHELARVYGWSEAEALAVGPARRRFYLEQGSAPGGAGLG